MQLNESHTKFIQTWGALGGNWGINKTMAQIHALLLIAKDPLSTEDVMDTLKISRGNTSMNLRALLDWGLIQKQLITGERKEFYVAKKDIWQVGRIIAKQRRKLELEPVLQSLGELRASEESKLDPEFLKRVEDIEDFAGKVDKILERFIESDENWFYKLLMKMV